MKLLEVMKRACFISKDFGMVLKFDLAGLSSCEDIERVCAHFASIAEKMPRKSIFGLVDLGRTPVADNILQTIASLSQSCSPHFKGTAVIAPDNAARVSALWLKRRFNRINLEIFTNEEDATKWLREGAQRKKRPFQVRSERLKSLGVVS